METQMIKATRREALGTKATRRLRKQGLVPAIVYSSEGAPEPIALPAHELKLSLHQSTHLLQVDIDGQQFQYLIKDAQYDHLGTDLIHLDLAKVDVHQVVEVKVPIDLRGTPVGVSDGGVVDQMVQDLAIRCRVTDIPDVIRLNVQQMKLGQTLFVRDLELPAGVEATAAPETPVVAVRALVEEEAKPAVAEAEGPAEPEVIGRQKKEEEPEAEG